MQSEFSASGSKAIGFREFVALAAALMATQAIAVDTMLPALPIISAALHVLNENRSQWIVTAYVVEWAAASCSGGSSPTATAGDRCCSLDLRCMPLQRCSTV